MIGSLASTALSLSLCFSPFGIDRPALYAPANAPDPHPSWGDEGTSDEPQGGDEGHTDAPTTSPTPDEATPASPPPPAATPPGGPPAGPPARPIVGKGTGLIVAAAVTGGLGWAAAGGKMALVRNCTDSIDTSSTASESTVGIFGCVFKTGVGLIALTPVNWLLNWASWGLAPAAGAVRGRHDGIAYAYDGTPDRKSVAYIAIGATVLGVGFIGNAATRLSVGKAVSCEPTDPDACGTKIIGYFAAIQATSSMVAIGAGLLAYGIAYQKNRNRYSTLLKEKAQLRILPQVSPQYAGLGFAGRF